MCNHRNSYYFHNNAPKFCPSCSKYLTDDLLTKDRKIKDRKRKMKKILNIIFNN